MFRTVLLEEDIMNYDKAHDLAHAMRESEEYKELMAAQEALKS